MSWKEVHTDHVVTSLALDAVVCVPIKRRKSEAEVKPDQRAVVSGTLVSLAVDHGHSAAAQISVTARLNCPPPSAPAKSLVGAELRAGRFGGGLGWYEPGRALIEAHDSFPSDTGETGVSPVRCI